MSAVGQAIAIAAMCITLLFGCNDDLRAALAERIAPAGCVTP